MLVIKIKKKNAMERVLPKLRMEEKRAKIRNLVRRRDNLLKALDHLNKMIQDEIIL